MKYFKDKRLPLSAYAEPNNDGKAYNINAPYIKVQSRGDILTQGPVNHAINNQQGFPSDIPTYPASASEIVAATNPDEILLKEVEDTITAFQPATFLLGTVAALGATKRFAGSMEVQYFSLGSDRVQSATTAAYTPSTSNPTPTAILPVPNDDVNLFPEDLLVQARGVPGFLDDGDTEDPNHDLLLQVVSRDDASYQPVFYAINGFKKNPTDPTTLVPRVPKGTVLYTLNTAASESQLFTAPSSHVPRAQTAFMQRKILNIQITKYFDKANKTVHWGREEILEAAIREFRRRSEINYLEGVKSKRMTRNAARQFSGQEFIYTSEGVLSQLRKKFPYTPGSFTFTDFIQLAEMIFADNDGAKHALLCVGKKLATDIFSLQYTLVKELAVSNNTHWGINMTDFTCIFGTISLIHYPILDEIGRSDQGFAIDPSRVIRYMAQPSYSENIDMAVHGEEAERGVYIETDCLVLKGDNHVLITPVLERERHHPYAPSYTRPKPKKFVAVPTPIDTPDDDTSPDALDL
ncbi:MAG: hypothetical protein LBT73_01455 [Tannerellaceae bacterium]|jgi:hypothetical protein|nr:hypothetical protein [Tannerellaceae bacterium]